MFSKRFCCYRVARATPVLGACLVIPFISWACASSPSNAGLLAVAGASEVTAAVTASTDQLDPVALLRQAQERCEREVRDYTCLFFKHERIDGELKLPQLIRVRHRDQPFSVDMTWVENAERVKRCVYVKGRSVSDDGEEQATVEPAGAIARLLVSRLDVPIHGEQAQKSSRFPIDQFGFRSTLQRINEENGRLARAGMLDWRIEGEGVVGGRPTWILVRHSPAKVSAGQAPVPRLVVHLDREWLLPVAVHVFADPEGHVVIGSYVTTDIKLNPGLGEVAFAP